MPWLIASQTIPILAIAPIVIVALGRGRHHRARAEVADLDLSLLLSGHDRHGQGPDLARADAARPDAHLYGQPPCRRCWKLRLPAALPFLFASLKVAVAISLVGAIVGELPTGAQAGLGARLLTGSYYGQTVQIWAALFAAAILAACLVAGGGAGGAPDRPGHGSAAMSARLAGAAAALAGSPSRPLIGWAHARRRRGAGPLFWVGDARGLGRRPGG